MDPGWEHEKQRLDVQASILDEGTRRRVERLGITEGWRCLEIGAGSGTIAAWLSERAGASGHVVATDTDTRFLDRLELPTLEVRRHDIVREALEPETYHLVHLRLVLVHLGDGLSAALSHIVAALKPGGWLLAEEHDDVATNEAYPADETLRRTQAAIDEVARVAGIDRMLGRKLPSYLQGAGLVDVDADGRLTMLQQGRESMRALTLFDRYMRDRIVRTGLVDTEAYDAMLALYDAPGMRWRLSPLMIAAWGRKPGVSSTQRAPRAS